MALVWWPWRGTQHNTTLFMLTGVIDMLAEISEEALEDCSGFRDSVHQMK